MEVIEIFNIRTCTPNLTLYWIRRTLDLLATYLSHMTRAACTYSVDYFPHIFGTATNTCSRSYKTFFLCCQRISPFFAAKLGHFTISDFFYMLQNTQTKQRKSENKEKKI